MRIFKSVVIAAIIGAALAGVLGQFTTSKYPPCDLVDRGIGISTYGCSDSSSSSSSPCGDIPSNTSEMASCVRDNYYKYKTYPFGFAQRFGPSSNLADHRPQDYNRVAIFVLGFVLTLPVVMLVSYRKVPGKQHKN